MSWPRLAEKPDTVAGEGCQLAGVEVTASCCAPAMADFKMLPCNTAGQPWTAGRSS